MSTTKQKSKFSRFLRNNAALLLIIFCVLAILAVVLAVTLTPSSSTPDSPVVVNPDPDDGKKPDVPDKPEPTTKTERIYFKSPIAASRITVQYTDGSDDALFEPSATLGGWRAHMGVDIAAEEGANVTAMYDGTVIATAYDFGMGNIVTIDHGEGVIATYASLGETYVNVGDQVKQGDNIGTVSTSASNEFLDGAHLHLSMTKNNKTVNPAPYVNGEIYREIEVAA